MIANKVFEGPNNFGALEWKKIVYDDTYEDAQLLHQCMTKRLKREDDPDYDPDLHIDGDAIRPNNGGGQYFQKPIFQCPECVRSYKSPVRMANHYRDKHPEKDLRSPYARFPNSQSTKILPQRDKRQQYDTNSPPRSPDVDNMPYHSYGYAHKHTRQEHERERFTANENTSQIINPYARHSPVGPTSTNSIYPTLFATTQKTTTNSSSASSSSSPSVSPVVSPSSSPPHPSSSSTSPITNHGNTKTRETRDSRHNGGGKTITVNGRTYECKGIKISTVNDEIKFVECLEKNKQRLHLASIAFSQGLISTEEYARKQREFLNAFSFF